MSNNLTSHFFKKFISYGIKNFRQEKKGTTMTQLVDIKVKDQFSHIYEAKALLRNIPESSLAAGLALFHKIEHIIVEGEVILPSIELVFESRESDSIFRVLE